jgi:hypothetical protein
MDQNEKQFNNYLFLKMKCYLQLESAILLTSLMLFLPSMALSDISTSAALEIPAVPLSSRASSVVRLVCSENVPFVLMSNGHGSSITSVYGFLDTCSNGDGIKEISLITGMKLQSSISGVFRTHCIHGFQFQSYTQGGMAPSISQSMVSGEPVHCN